MVLHLLTWAALLQGITYGQNQRFTYENKNIECGQGELQPPRPWGNIDTLFRIPEWSVQVYLTLRKCVAGFFFV